MKKFNKKKIIYLAILILIIGFLLSMYNSFNGNPISKAIAKGKIEKYIKGTYPEKDFKIKNVGYKFKFSNYYAQVVSEKDGLKFNIDIRKDNSFYDEYKESPILVDYELSRRFIETIESNTKEDLKGIVEFDSEDGLSKSNNFLFAQFDIPQGKYRDRETQYSNTMDDPFAIYINLYPEDSTGYREELLKVTKALKASVNKRNYNGILGIMVNIGWDNTSYCIVLNKDEISVSDDELENYIQEGYASYKGAYGNYEMEINHY